MGRLSGKLLIIKKGKEGWAKEQGERKFSVPACLFLYIFTLPNLTAVFQMLAVPVL